MEMEMDMERDMGEDRGNTDIWRCDIMTQMVKWLGAGAGAGAQHQTFRVPGAVKRAISWPHCMTATRGHTTRVAGL